MLELTPQQRGIHDFIASEVASGRAVPSLREIARHFGFASKTAVVCHLRSIEAKGFLLSEPGKARALRVTSPLAKLRNRIVDIPLFGSIPAGFPQAREQDAEGCISVDMESIGYKSTKPLRNAFALQVTGDSMIGAHICDGDIVILEFGPDPRSGQIVAAYIDGENTLKTYLVQNGKPYLKAENPKYRNLIPAQDLTIQGVFRALIRRAKE